MAAKKQGDDTGALIKDENTRKLIESLGLLKYFPNKITIQIAQRKVKRCVKTEKDLPWYFIGKVLSGVDQKGWYTFDHIDDTKKEEKLNPFKDCNGDLEDASGQEEDIALEHIGEKYNPIDLKVAVFLCADNLLQRVLAQKLFRSNLSMPFVIPDITDSGRLDVLWWFLLGISPDTEVARTPAHIVSFLRLTTLPISYTEMLNRLLFDQSHDVFYKPQSKKSGSKVKANWCKSLVEMGIYQPSPIDLDYSSSNFNQLTMLLAMSGNCKDVPQHKELLCSLSTLVVLVLDVSKLSLAGVIDNIVNVADQSSQMLMVFAKDDKFKPKEVEPYFKKMQDRLRKHTNVTSIVLDEKNMNSRLLSTLQKTLNTNPSTVSLHEKFDNMKIANVFRNTDERTCKEALDGAQCISNELQRKGFVKVKETAMPLQCKHWAQWSDIERRFRSGVELPEAETQDLYIERMMEEQRKLREAQVGIYSESMSAAMKMFCSFLIDNDLDNRKKVYFLEWLEILLRDVCRQEKQEYRRQISELDGEEDKTKRKIKKLNNDILSVSFDDRHFFREIGQIIEACSSCSDESLKQKSDELSKTVAALFLEGQMLELFDSTAKQVPITFLSSVLFHAKELMKNQRENRKVFVLSILGLQKSGKSTLLNAMFGTKFANNTKGINMQLIPIPVDRRTNGYESILLLDAKGLHGTERFGDDPCSADNELATLLFGVSDLTIVDMKGAAEAVAQNVLELAINAMLRVKKVNKRLCIESRCLFLHHIVETKSKKDVQGESEALIENLDRITRDMAARTNIPNVSKFSDIIKFDFNNDILYLPDLCQGTPPVALNDSRYSEQVIKLVDCIYERIMPSVTGFKGDMSSFSIRLQDVWEALLGEDFISSFRNHVKFNAFEALEVKFCKLRWSLNNFFLRACNVLKGSKDEKKNLEDNIHAELGLQNEKLLDFFENTDEGRLLQEFKLKYVKLLRQQAKMKIAVGKRLIKREKEMRKRKEEAEPLLRLWKAEARKKAFETAERELKMCEKGVKFSKTKAEKAFEELWTELLSSLPNHRKINLVDTLKTVLSEVGRLQPDHIKKIDFKSQTDDQFEAEWNHLQVNSEVSTSSEHTCATIRRDITLTVFEGVKTYLSEIRNDILEKPHVEQTLQLGMKQVHIWEADHPGIVITEQHKMSLLIRTSKFALPFYEAMQDLYEKSIEASIEEHKSVIQCIYHNTVEKVEAEKTAAMIFCNMIKMKTKEKVETKLCETLPETIRKSSSSMQSKQKFIDQALKDLLRIDKFQEYMKFIEEPEEYLAKNLKEHLNLYLYNENKVYAKMAFPETVKVLEDIDRVVNAYVEEQSENSSVPGMIRLTIDRLMEETNRHLPNMNRKESVQDICANFKENSNMGLFIEFLTSEYKKILGSLEQEYHDMKTMPFGMEKHVTDQLLEQLLGCTKRCPSCTVMCSSAVKGHRQECSASYHYQLCFNGVTKMTPKGKLELRTCNRLIASQEKFRAEKVAMNVPLSKDIFNAFIHSDSDQDISFKTYIKAYPDWKVHADAVHNGNLYWQRFLGKFSKQLADYHKCSAPDIPETWRNITSAEALESLRSTR